MFRSVFLSALLPGFSLNFFQTNIHCFSCRVRAMSVYTRSYANTAPYPHRRNVRYPYFQVTIFPLVFGMFNDPSHLFFAVSKGSPLHGRQLWRDLVTRKPRLPSFSKAVATVSLISPLYKMTRYRLVRPDHGLRQLRSLSTGQPLSAVKDRMDQLPGQSDHCAAVHHYRHHPCHSLPHPNRLRRPIFFTSYLPLLRLPPLYLPSVPQSRRVTWRL